MLERVMILTQGDVQEKGWGINMYGKVGVAV